MHTGSLLWFCKLIPVVACDTVPLTLWTKSAKIFVKIYIVTNDETFWSSNIMFRSSKWPVIKRPRPTHLVTLHLHRFYTYMFLKCHSFITSPACGTRHFFIQSCGPFSDWWMEMYSRRSWDLFEKEIVALLAMDRKRTCSGLQLTVKKTDGGS